jgi:hypothetical protein
MGNRARLALLHRSSERLGRSRTRFRQFVFGFQLLFVFDCALDGLDGALDDDEGLTHPFRLTALGRSSRDTATLAA